MKSLIRCFFVAFMAALTANAFAVADFSWTFNNNGTSDWQILNAAGVSDTSVYSGSFPANDPTLNLVVGKRYNVTIVNGSFHTFQVLARQTGANTATDIVLLSSDALTTGSLETDSDIHWTDTGTGTNEHVEFTLTQGLADAMVTASPVRQPGYRCGIHTSSMRGFFNVTGGIPSPTPSPSPTPTVSPTPSISLTPSLSPTASLSPTISPTPSVSPSPTPTPITPIGNSSWTFTNDDIIAYQIPTAADISDTSVYAGPFPADNPTLKLRLNRRYHVTVIDADMHPLEIIARDLEDGGNDQSLLGMNFNGSFQFDNDVNWTDDHADPRTVAFTVTQPLVDAMNSDEGGFSRGPGYRCTVHGFSMRGFFEIEPAASTHDFIVEVLLGQQSNPGSLDLTGDSRVDAADLGFPTR